VGETRPSPPAPPAPPSLTAGLEESLALVGRALRRELRSAIITLLVSAAEGVLVLMAVFGLVVAGALRLGDALAHLLGDWFGNQALGDLAVGLLLTAIPLALLWRARRRALDDR
jgi:hypothetical protein